MARHGLFVIAVALLVGAACALAGPAEDDAKVRAQLAVQMALQQGRENLQRGNYQAAVYALESQVARVDGNREYMNALRDAYRGYIRELQQANRQAEIPTYLTRLQILDPGSQLELAPLRPPAPTSQTPGASRAPTTSAAPPPSSPVLAVQAAEGRPMPRPASAPASPPPAITARPQMPEEDPFADANSASQAGEVRPLLTQADQEFARGHYAAAGRLYEQAHKIDSRALSGSREQWAYCKLHAVVEALNRLGGNPPPPELEQEVRLALSLSSAPQMLDFAKKLQQRLQHGPDAGAETARIEVRHTAAQGLNWSVAETTNFRVLHRQSRDLAEQVARTAEATRLAMTRKWFGEEPAPWNPRCDIVLHTNAQDYSRATGVPPASPGHSTMHAEGERMLVRRIDLRCDESHMLDAVLPHETTHVVLAGRFGRHVVPRWADEGMAVLTEPRDRIERHLNNLPRHQRDRQLFPIGQLMRMPEYPNPHFIGPFYAQSVSLVEFLSTRPGGPQRFAQFLRDGLDNGYEAALRRHYGMQSFDELERRWQEHAFGGGTSASVAGKPR
jgi:hypothetical protein